MQGFQNRLAKMKADMQMTSTTYDSINAMHTNAVFDLSKMNTTK